MIDLNIIVGFEWDGGNARKNSYKHDVTQSEAEQVFFNSPLFVLLDEKHSKREIRYHALGKADSERQLHVTFTLRTDSTLIRVISARDMHRKERAVYDQA